MALGSPVLDVVLSILGATASDAGPQLAARWLNERYVEFVGRARTHQLQHYASVFVPAPLSNGTVNVTQGSATVTGTGTNFTSANIGWTFRSSVNWFVVIAVNGQTLTLDSPYSEVSNTAASYQLVQRYIPTVSDCRWISNVAHQRLRKRLRFVTTAEMQTRYPSRQLVGGFPSVWTEAARLVEDTDISGTLGTQGQKLFEVYPPTTTAETYIYTYWSVPQTLTITSTIPPEVDEYVLREGVLVDVYRYKSEKALNKALEMGTNAESLQHLAEVWANKESRQRTIWENAIQAAIVADAAYHNQITLEIVTLPYADNWDRDIETAHDWIVSTWPQ